jgi:hypothetical protein
MTGVSPELMQKVALWRSKIMDNTITLDEMREAVQYLRADREKAAVASRPAKGKSSSTRPARSADDLLSDFENS